MIPPSRRKLSDAQRASLKTQLEKRFSGPRPKTEPLAKRFVRPVRQGMSRKLFSGEDVEKYITPIVEEFKTTAGKDIGNRSDAVNKRLEQRMNAMFQHFINRIDRVISEIPTPKDGHTPTKEEILVIAGPAIAELRSSFEKQLFMFSEPKEGELPVEMEQFDQMMRVAIKKWAPKSKYGGGGPKHFYELLDVPGKTERYGPAPYKGYENKYLRVKTNGTGLEWVDISAGGANIATETVTATDAGGGNVDIDLTQLTEPWTTIQMVTRNGQILDKIRWSVVADVLTVTGAITTNSFQVQYTY